MKSRKQRAHEVRINAAKMARDRAHAVHRANGDERRIPRHAANFTKGLPHCKDTGLILEVKGRDLFEEFVRGIDTGAPADFRLTALGPHTITTGAEPAIEEDYVPATGWNWKSDIAYPDGRQKAGVKVRAWESAAAGNTFDLEGPDAQAVTMPPAPTIGSDELTAEIAELYCQALLRDVPFNVMRCGAPESEHRKKFDHCVEELNKLEWFKAGSQDLSPEERARKRGPLDAQTAFRGIAPGDNVGPYISQFLLIGNLAFGDDPISTCDDKLKRVQQESSGYIRYGALRIDQRVRKVVEKDYMTTWEEWLDVQNGADVRKQEKYDTDPAYRFIATPRDIATYVHHDALYEAYLNACLILLARDVPFDPGIPYQGGDHIDHQQGFAHFGGPHILSLVTEVATRALKAVRFQKFNNHRRLRPEALAARLEKANELSRMCGFSGFARMRNRLDGILADIQEHNRSNVVYTPTEEGACLLPMAFPEGSPMHPSYGAGHATVAGACVTILKAFFDHSQEFKVAGCSGKAYVANNDGTQLELFGVYEADCKTPACLTVEGELNKLAANIAIGRDWAGVHYFTDYWESLLLGERIALGILDEQKLTYGESFSMTVPLFEGGSVRI